MAAPSKTSQWRIEVEYLPDGSFDGNTLSGFKLERCMLKTGAGVVGEFTCLQPLADAHVAPLAEFGARINLYDHTNTVRFRGKRVQARRRYSGPGEMQSLRFVDAWWELEKRKFQQEWYLWVRDISGATLLPYYRPHAILNNGISLAAQITQVITYAQNQGVRIQPGTITCRTVQANPATEIYAPTSERTCEDVASVLKWLFAFAPLNVPWFDYATDPPTLHFQPASELTAVTVPFTTLEDLDIESRDEDTAPGVIIHYERTDTITKDGVTRERPVFYTDAFPPATTGREERAVAEVVSLAGFSTSTITADVLVGALPGALNNTAAFETLAALDFWKQKLFGLNLEDTRIKPDTLSVVAGSFSAVAAKSDEDDAPSVNVDLTNYLIAGQLADWMEDSNGDPLEWQNVVLTVQFSYDEYSEREPDGTYLAAKKIGETKNHSHKVYLKVTNAPSGLNTFSTDGPGEEGELPPIGYAEFLYNQLKDPGWQGVKRRIQNECDGSIKMGNLINIAGGKAEWTTMASLVQSVTENIDDGETSVQFGVSASFNLGILMQLDRAHRTRRRWTSLAQQVTGEL